MPHPISAAVDWIESASREHPDKLVVLAYLLARADGDPWGWADTIQALISAGHGFAEIKGYTIAQCRAFLGAIERRERQRRYGDAIAARMAQADGKAWKTYIKGLERGG